MMMPEKEALKELLAALQMGAAEEDDAEKMGNYASTRDQYDVEPEDIEAELYDEDQDIDADALDTQAEAMEADDEMEAEAEEDAEEEMSLRDLVAQFMNEREDPFEDKQGMTMVSSPSSPKNRAMQVEIIKAAKMPGKKRKKR